MTDAEIEFMEHFGAGLDAAVGKRHLPNPALASDNPNETDSSAYIRAVRARLIELGYLGEGKKSINRDQEKLDRVLEKKIRRFQKEVGIEEDGWVGPKTWRMLECLVSFENQQDPERWRDIWKTPENLVSSKAVMRGVYCRLYALGFFADWERDRINTRTEMSPSANEHFRSAIERFCQFAKLLELAPPSCTGLSVELLIALYEYDKLVARLGNDELFSRVAADFRDSIDAIARVELWLLGYDIAPGEDQTVRQKGGVITKTGHHRRISKTRLAIESFCADNEQAIPGFPRLDRATAELMAAFSTLSDEPEKDVFVGRQLNKTVDKILADEAGKKELENQFSRIANGIFDGIRRVVRWLFRIVSRIVKFTRQFIANIVRCISRKARRFYLGVVKAFDIVYSGMTYLKKSAWHFTSPAKMVFGHDRDFDQFCLVSPGLPPEQLSLDTRQYGLRSRLYAAGLNIVGHLMRMAHRVLKAVTSPFGWLLALLSLSSLANSVKAIRRQIDLVRDYELDIEHRRALFSTRIT